MSLDSTLLFAAIVAQMAILTLLSIRGMWRVLPMFCIYIGCGLLTDLSATLFWHYENNLNYARIWQLTSEINRIVEALVLFEISFAVWRRRYKPRSLRNEALLATLIAAAGLALWPVAEKLSPQYLPRDLTVSFSFDELLSLLFIACGVALLLFRRRLSLKWTNPEFQVAVGMGFWSAVSLLASILQLAENGRAFPRLLDQIAEASYIITLVFWICCFSRPRTPAIETE